MGTICLAYMSGGGGALAVMLLPEFEGQARGGGLGGTTHTQRGNAKLAGAQSRTTVHVQELGAQHRVAQGLAAIGLV